MLEIITPIVMRSNLISLVMRADTNGTLYTKIGVVDMRVVKSLALCAKVSALDGTGSYPLMPVLCAKCGHSYAAVENVKNDPKIIELMGYVREVLTAKGSGVEGMVWVNPTVYTSKATVRTDISANLVF